MLTYNENIFRSKVGLASFHDAIFEITGNSYSQESLIKIFQLLPDSIQSIANNWGLSDTEFRDIATNWLNSNLLFPDT